MSLFSNGSVEVMFSTLKLVKTNRIDIMGLWRTRLHLDTLSDLLEIPVEGPVLRRFSPMQAVEAWWKDCRNT